MTLSATNLRLISLPRSSSTSPALFGFVSRPGTNGVLETFAGSLAETWSRPSDFHIEVMTLVGGDRAVGTMSGNRYRELDLASHVVSPPVPIPYTDALSAIAYDPTRELVFFGAADKVGYVDRRAKRAVQASVEIER